MFASSVLSTACAVVIFWITVCPALGSASRIRGNQEVCQMESFKAKCPESHVVLMEHARYGRMNLGRCLNRDYYVGCSGDVRGHMDTRCSGRQECKVQLPDPVMVQAQPCPKDLVAYMEARYTCLPVVQGDAQQCTSQKHVKAPGSTGHIASVITQQTGSGSPNCPWRLEALPGQRFNITLLDFSRPSNSNGETETQNPARHRGNTGSSSSHCTVYGHITEEGQTKHTRICGSHFHRESRIYTSKSHVVDVSVGAEGKTEFSPYFLLKYEVFGCPMPEAPEGGHVEVDGDIAHVYCNNTNHRTQWVCAGTEWVGDARNCSAEVAMDPLENQVKQEEVQYGLFIAIGIGLALGVILGITLLMVFYSCYKKSSFLNVVPPSCVLSILDCLSLVVSSKNSRKNQKKGHYPPIVKEGRTLLKNNPKNLLVEHTMCPAKGKKGGALHTTLHVAPPGDCTYMARSAIPFLPVQHTPDCHLYECTNNIEDPAWVTNLNNFHEYNDSGVDERSLMTSSTSDASTSGSDLTASSTCSETYTSRDELREEIQRGECTYMSRDELNRDFPTLVTFSPGPMPPMNYNNHNNNNSNSNDTASITSSTDDVSSSSSSNNSSNNSSNSSSDSSNTTTTTTAATTTTTTENSGSTPQNSIS